MSFFNKTSKIEPPFDPKLDWEEVPGGLVRIEVPGGWIYYESIRAHAVAMTFVPKPTHELKENK